MANWWLHVAGDMRICRHRRTSAGSGPHFFRPVRLTFACPRFPVADRAVLYTATAVAASPPTPQHGAPPARPGGHRLPAGSASRPGGQPRHAAGEPTGQPSRRRATRPRSRTTTPRTRRRHLRRSPRPRNPAPPATSPSRSSPTSRRDPPDCLLLVLPPAHPHARPLLLAAAPPPALPLHAWAAPRFIWQVEEGGSSAKRWTPLPRKPRRDAKSGPEAGRRPGDLLRPPARDHQPQTTTPTRGHLRSPAAWPLRPWDLGRPSSDRSLRSRVHAEQSRLIDFAALSRCHRSRRAPTAPRDSRCSSFAGVLGGGRSRIQRGSCSCLSSTPKR